MSTTSPALVLLTGNSEKTKPWIEDLAKTLQPLFSSTTAQEYDHWGKGQDAVLDVAAELAKLEKTVAHFERYVLLGKSAGCLVILKGIREGTLDPAFCIFLGLPVAWAKTNNNPLDLYLHDYAVPTLFLQKEHDPAIGAKELALLLQEKQVLNSQLVAVPGNDHHYEDLQLIKQSVQAFLKTQDA